MSDIASLIADNYARVCERIALAAEASGRRAKDITLVGVTKYVGPNEAAFLLQAGCTNLGESRPQQLWEKAADESLTTAHWHMIGHLQRNKVRRTLPQIDLIHSVDSLRLAKSIDQEAAALGSQANVLLEVNCSGDLEKHGLTAQQLKELLPELVELPHLNVRGLMTMAARAGGTSVAAENFASLRVLRDELVSAASAGIALPELSMGMSYDFEEAIREGATIVRVGSLLVEGVPR